MAIYSHRSGGSSGRRDPRDTNTISSSPTPRIPGQTGVGSGLFSGTGRPGSSTNPNIGSSGPYRPGSVNREELDLEQLRDLESVIDRLKESSIFQESYALYSSKPEYRLFLLRLEGIMNSVNSNYKTWLDDLGLSNNYQDSLTEAYNYAIEQMQLLLKEFHEWHNSLPSVQAQQFSDAGVNSAITGQGLTGSSLNGETAQRSFVESTNPAEVLTSISDIALNKIPGVVSTVTGVWKSLQDVRLAGRSQDLSERIQGFNEQSTLASIRKSLIEQGFSLGDQQWNSLSDFHSWTTKISSDPKLSKMFKDSSVGQFFSDLSYNGIMSKVKSHPYSWTDETFGKTFEEFYNDLGNFQLSTYMNKLEYDSLMSKFNRDFISVRNGEKSGNLQNLTDEMNSFKAGFEKQFYNQKLSFINSWIKRIQDSYDPVAKFALSKVLFNDNLVSGLDLGSEALRNVIDEFKSSGNTVFKSPVGIGTNLGF